MNWDKQLNRIIEYSFYLLFTLTPLVISPVSFELFEFPKIIILYTFSIVIGSAWIIKMIVHHQVLLKKTFLDLPFKLFLVSQIISTFLSIDPHTSIWGYYSRFHGGLISTLSYLTLYYAYASNLLGYKKIAKNLIGVILSTGVIVSIYGILEHFGIDKHIWVQDVQNRVFSTLGQPNWLASYLTALLPLSLALSLKNNLNLIPFSIFLITLTFTKSKSGLVGFIGAYSIFWTLYLLYNKFNFKKVIKNIFPSLLIILGVSLVWGTPYSPSFYKLTTQSSPIQNPLALEKNSVEPASITLGGSKSSDIRKVVWRGAYQVWQHYPIFGSGVETFAYSYYNFRPVEHNLLSEWDYLYNKAHNEYLNFLATTGAFGLFSYLSIILSFCWYSYKQLKSKNNPHLPLQLSLVSGFLGIAISNFFGFSVVPVATLFFVWPIISLALDSNSNNPNQPKKYFVLSSFSYISITLTLITGFYLLIAVFNYFKTDKIFALGKNNIKANQIELGYQLLNKAVTKSPKEPLYLSELSQAEAKMAILYHQEVSNPQVATQAGLLRDQFVNQAITHSDQSVQLNTVHLNYWKSRIKVFLTLAIIDPNYYHQTLDATLKSIELSPTDAKLYYNLGLIYSKLSQTSEAQTNLETAVDLKSNYEAAHYALGSLYQQTNQLQLAKEQYQYILDYLNPQNQQVQKNLEQLQL